MSGSIELRRGKYLFSKKAFKGLLNWLFIGVLSFIAVVLLHQLTIGAISLALGYETHIHFGKVDSFPQVNRFWSGTRVLALYALPSVGLIMASAFMLIALLFAPKGDINWRWVAFWLMIVAVLLGTTLMSISLISELIVNGSLFQGFAVVTRWFGLSIYWSIALLILSGVINIAFGFLCSEVLLNLAPSDFIIRDERNSPRTVVINTFVYPMLLLFPVAIALSYPGHFFFFVVMFFHACLWLPGLLNISETSLRKRRSRGKNVALHSNYLLCALAIAGIIVVRLFFS